MIRLNGTSQSLQIVTSAASSIDYDISWEDITSSADTPDTSSGNITSATSTTVVAAPATSTIRQIRSIYLANKSSSVSSVITVNKIITGPATIQLYSINLLPGEIIEYSSNMGFVHYDSNGAHYTYNVPTQSKLGASGTIAETMPRELCPETNTTVGASGTLFMQAIYLAAGTLVANITLWSATTAAGTPTNYNVGLYDSNRNLLAQGTNKTTEAWAANSSKTFVMVTAYRIPTSGLYYIGYYMTATTVATLKGGVVRTGNQLGGAAPILSGTSSSGLTTSLPNPGAVITSSSSSFYAAIS